MNLLVNRLKLRGLVNECPMPNKACQKTPVKKNLPLTTQHVQYIY